MNQTRAFLAIPLTRPLQESISVLQSELRHGIPEARWTHAENLHLTLHFFGDIDQETLEKIKVSVLSVKRCHRPFLVELKGLGAFPDPRRPRVIWLGLEPREQLNQLHRVTRSLLRQVGVATESRPFAPHLTIGRLRQRRPDLTKLFSTIGPCSIGQLKIDRVVLYESRLHPGGAEHLPLLTVKLDDDNHDVQKTT